MTLKQAICEYLQEQLNNEWVNLKGIGSDKPFVFTTDFTYDTGDMTLFDENGNPIFTKYNSFERYIPCSVFSIIGDRVAIPNIQILDTIIPIEMLVDNGKLDDVLICLETFQDNINAKPIVLTAFYKGQDVEYNIIMTFNMPDDDTFRNIQGMNAKIVDFQISALVTTEVYFGNSITYELSLDNGNTFTPLIRTDNSNSRVVENHTQQIINDDFSKATPKFNVWGMPITAIISKNTPLKDLIVLTDFPEMYNILGYSENPLYNAVLKIHYNDLGFDFLVDIPITLDNEFHSGDFIALNGTYVPPTQNTFVGFGTEETISFYSNGQISFVDYEVIILRDTNGNYRNTAYESRDKNLKYTPNFLNGEFLNSGILTFNYNGVIKNTLPSSTNLFIQRYIGDNLTKNVIISELSYDANIGDFITITMTFNDRLVF